MEVYMSKRIHSDCSVQIEKLLQNCIYIYISYMKDAFFTSGDYVLLTARDLNSIFTIIQGSYMAVPTM